MITSQDVRRSRPDPGHLTQRLRHPGIISFMLPDHHVKYPSTDGDTGLRRLVWLVQSHTGSGRVRIRLQSDSRMLPFRLPLASLIVLGLTWASQGLWPGVEATPSGKDIFILELVGVKVLDQGL